MFISGNTLHSYTQTHINYELSIKLVSFVRPITSSQKQTADALWFLFGECWTEFKYKRHLCLSERHCKPAVRCYGVCMPTCSPNPKLFFVAASHLSIWDCYVTDEVMTYYPKKSTKQYFEIRSDVRCLTSVKDDKLILAVHVRSCLVRQQVKQSSGSVATVPTWQIYFYVFLKSKKRKYLWTWHSCDQSCKYILPYHHKLLMVQLFTTIKI